ncbi:MAG: hypothetical protein ABI549_09550 [Flavobacterium sp.]|uniref:hypothetical protein n=1 Tax=Flavobacterium sp. TaxID=239 RepID=UPI0032641B6F
MEPNRLENQIAEKLNSREIQPSVQAWDRLDAMLSVAEKKKPKKRLSWLYIAASIIGFVFVGLLFYNQENTSIKTNNQVVVESNTNKKAVLPEEVNQSETINNPKEEVLAIIESKKESIKVKNRNQKAQQFVKIQSENKEVIAEVIPQKTEEKAKIENNTTTLLASIETNKEQTKNVNKPKLKIDASALLSQVDGEITLTFRQKVLKSINKNYDSAKEALASRNQE